MTIIETHVIVAPDGTLSLSTPLPPGKYDVEVTRTGIPLDHRADAAFDRFTFPKLELGPWPEDVDLSREGLYD